MAASLFFKTHAMILYRYIIYEPAGHDADGELISPLFPNPSLSLIKYNVIKETKHGWWIDYGTKGKWVSKTARSRFAYPTNLLALNHFIKRTEKRGRILKWQLRVCEISVSLAKELMP